MYGKQTERAIGAMSRLAEVWDEGKTRLSAIEIADDRALPRPMVAKILTMLSQAHLVVGSPGPGGGYALSRHPSEICFQEVFELFEREDSSHMCPFGGGVCGVGDCCAMHDRLLEMRESIKTFMINSTFEMFRVAWQVDGIRPTKSDVMPVLPRETYRAAKMRE